VVNEQTVKVCPTQTDLRVWIHRTLKSKQSPSRRLFLFAFNYFNIKL
jgi:hypothetical protein